MRPFPTFCLLPLTLCLLLAACGSDAPDADAAGAEAPEALLEDARPLDSGSLEARMSRYQLSMDVLRTFPAVYQSLADAVEADPAIVDRLEPIGEETFEQSVARLNQEPAFRKAVEDAGISVEDYLLTTVAIASAEMYQAFPDAYDEITTPPAQHIDFVQRNRAEIDRISTQLQAIEEGIDL